MKAGGSRRKILIVDDEERILRSTKMLLEVLGYDAVTLNDPKRVVETAERERPDLILQDIKMPGIDVPAIVGGLKANRATQEIPFVFFSASPHLPEVAAEHDAKGYLAKPFREHELLDILDHALPGPARAREGIV